MKSVVKLTVLALALVAVSGCAANRYCRTSQAYDNAPSIPPLVGTPDLKIPTTSTALKIPEPHGEPLRFGYETPDPQKPGKTKIECLDKPPPIPPLADATTPK